MLVVKGNGWKNPIAVTGIAPPECARYADSSLIGTVVNREQLATVPRLFLWDLFTVARETPHALRDWMEWA